MTETLRCSVHRDGARPALSRTRGAALYRRVHGRHAALRGHDHQGRVIAARALQGLHRPGKPVVLVALALEIGVLHRFADRRQFLEYSDGLLTAPMVPVCPRRNSTRYLLDHPPRGRGFNVYDWGGHLIGRGVGRQAVHRRAHALVGARWHALLSSTRACMGRALISRCSATTASTGPSSSGAHLLYRAQRSAPRQRGQAVRRQDRQLLREAGIIPRGVRVKEGWLSQRICGCSS